MTIVAYARTCTPLTAQRKRMGDVRAMDMNKGGTKCGCASQSLHMLGDDPATKNRPLQRRSSAHRPNHLALDPNLMGHRTLDGHMLAIADPSEPMYKKDKDVPLRPVPRANPRSRTPSPTPSELKQLNTGAIDWRSMRSWRFWLRREWLCECIPMITLTNSCS